MADNTTLNTGTGGDVVASDDIGAVKFQRVKLIHGADGVNAGDVSTANPFPVQARDSSGNAIGSILSAGIYNQAIALGATNYISSTNNSSTVQLAASATFTGVIETAFNQQSFSILITSDQNGTLTIKQYIDAGGTRLASSNAYTTTASVPFARSGVINGNYINITYQNTGGSTTTTLNVDTAYGTIPSATQLNNGPVALNEVNGTAISLGQTTKALSLPITIASDVNFVSVVNSSVATLGIGAVFTGTSEDISQYAEVRVHIFADQASATDGLSLQQSVNGTNWDTTDVYTIPASTGKHFGVGVSAKFFRLVYTNGGVANTVFRLQTSYHVFATKPSSQRPQDARTNDNDFEEMSGFNHAFNGTTWDRVRSGQSAATATLTGLQNVLAGGIYNSTPPVLTNGQTVPAQLDVNGNQKVIQPVALATGNITTQNLVPAGTATAGSAVEATITTQGMATVQVTGTYTGALSLQYTVNGTDWVTHATGNDAAFFNVNTGSYAFTIASGTTGIFRIPTTGAVKVRITGLAAMTGTATVTINAVNAVIPAQSSRNINQNLVGGATIAVNRGVSGSGVQRTIAAQEITYRASTIIPLVAAVTVNVPFFNIIGSATKTVVVKRITVSGMTLTAVGYYAINAEKLSTASTAGTSTTLVATPLDSADAAATAVVKAYTIAPTKGTLVGTLRSWRALWQSTTAAAGGVPGYYDFNFGDIPSSKGVVLRGVAQELALTFPVVLASAGTLAVDIEWTEE